MSVALFASSIQNQTNERIFVPRADNTFYGPVTILVFQIRTAQREIAAGFRE